MYISLTLNWCLRIRQQDAYFLLIFVNFASQYCKKCVKNVKKADSDQSLGVCSTHTLVRGPLVRIFNTQEMAYLYNYVQYLPITFEHRKSLSTNCPSVPRTQPCKNSLPNCQFQSVFCSKLILLKLKLKKKIYLWSQPAKVKLLQFPISTKVPNWKLVPSKSTLSSFWNTFFVKVHTLKINA